MPKNFIFKIFAQSKMDDIVYCSVWTVFWSVVICPDTEWMMPQGNFIRKKWLTIIYFMKKWLAD